MAASIQEIMLWRAVVSSNLGGNVLELVAPLSRIFLLLAPTFFLIAASLFFECQDVLLLRNTGTKAEKTSAITV